MTPLHPDDPCVAVTGQPIPAVLLANKCDAPGAYANCTKRELAELSDELGFARWYEVSAKEDTNISQAMQFLVECVFNTITESDRRSMGGAATPSAAGGGVRLGSTSATGSVATAAPKEESCCA
jgi:predicted GTPase